MDAVERDHSPLSAAQLVEFAKTDLSFASDEGDVIHAQTLPMLGHGGGYYFEIYANNRLAYRDLHSIQAWWFYRFSSIRVVDIDGNGLEDVVKPFYNGAQGLMLGQDVYFYLQIAPERFQKFSLAAEAFAFSDIFDIDGDGIYEIVNSIVQGGIGPDRKIHNYWIYRCWNLTLEGLVNVDEKCGLPLATLFTHQENHRLASWQTHQNLVDRFEISERYFKAFPDQGLEQTESFANTLARYLRGREERIHPKLVMWWSRLGDMYESLGDTEMALNCFEEALRRSAAFESNQMQPYIVDRLQQKITSILEANDPPTVDGLGL